jgi:phosphoribosyl 1,2-cyclic phosphodiesterase
MTVTVSVLGSGSRGNATFIRTDRVRLLIDAGMSRREIGKRLESIGEDPDGIDAVLVTHEHTDHSSGVRTLVKDLPVRVYMTWGTITQLHAEDFELNGSSIVPILPDVPFLIGDAEVVPVRVPHDAAQPVCFTVRSAGIKVTQLTDIGYVPESLAQHVLGSDILILESNHDLEMLRVGSYPWSLKQRLMSRHGHLSNTAVARFLLDQFDGRARNVVLAHLSSQNNHPELARQEAMRALRSPSVTRSEPGRPDGDDTGNGQPANLALEG